MPTRVGPFLPRDRAATIVTCEERCGVLLVEDDPKAVEADLAAGRVSCPDCGGRLARWGFAPERKLRTLGGVRHLRPRRAMCSSCRVTHVLEPASTLPRLRDTAEVVGWAWQAKVAGAGHRTIARRLDRPVSTVRRWLRRLRARAEELRVAATGRLHDLDPTAGPIEPAGSPRADAPRGRGPGACGLRPPARAPPGVGRRHRPYRRPDRLPGASSWGQGRPSGRPVGTEHQRGP